MEDLEFISFVASRLFCCEGVIIIVCPSVYGVR